ncbi:MAG: MFS transporter [Edaphobacter sp.]|uniref:MFS transporter n=1 Tax=Edaphobacter sp. TaxID=1934404 RepID=UPI00239621F3|nr:MFS transporter [Edaphobacter sp.]MDE1178311.1 MFS transporter [Edaphobacter sp.]
MSSATLHPSRSLTDREVTKLTLPAVAFTFVAYLSIGAPLALLPSYLHLGLGLSTVIAGLIVSAQYIATFASRPLAGHMSDVRGPKVTVRYGLLLGALSGLLIVTAHLAQRTMWLGLSLLILSRLALGAGESLTSTGATMWGIGRVGVDHTARVISWNGVATYTALAVGAPLGTLLGERWGFWSVGAMIMAICLGSYVAAERMAPTAAAKGKRAPMGGILLRVMPYGAGLALGGMGFGVIATFIALYFAQAGWQGAPLSLTIYGLCFVGVRLLFPGVIARYGGFTVTLVSLAVELAGLAMLGLTHTHALAYVASGLTGLGFSLVFPALGVEAAKAFPASVRGAVLGVYTAFVDLSLFLSGPLAGAVIRSHGYGAAFLATAGMVLVALLVVGTMAISVRSKTAISS